MDAALQHPFRHTARDGAAVHGAGRRGRRENRSFSQVEKPGQLTNGHALDTIERRQGWDFQGDTGVLLDQDVLAPVRVAEHARPNGIMACL